MRDIPTELLSGPFTRDTARGLEITDRMLQGTRFVRVFPRVWRHRDHELSSSELRQAARLAMPATCHLTGISRIQELGLDHDPVLPVRFVTAGDLHLTPPGIFLHRTKRLPPLDEHGATPAAAFLSWCRHARVIDAIKVGDWLLHHNHATTEDIRALALAQLWRDGAHEAIWALDHLDGVARSLKESETRVVLTFAGLPTPESNIAVPVEPGIHLIGDLVYRGQATVVEYEGAQHQNDRTTYVADHDRYALYRRAGLRYVQVTQEKLTRPKSMVAEVYRELLAGGYTGPAPDFGDRWRLLFLPLSVAVGSRAYPSGAAAGRQLS